MGQSDDGSESELQGALAQIDRLFDAREHERAIELCTALIERFPTEPMPYYERAQARYMLRRQRAALDDLYAAVERLPNDVRFLFFRGSGLWSSVTTSWPY